jgi:hypothetical protein
MVKKYAVVQVGSLYDTEEAAHKVISGVAYSRPRIVVECSMPESRRSRIQSLREWATDKWHSYGLKDDIDFIISEAIDIADETQGDMDG